MKKKGKAIILIAVLLVGLTISTGIAMDLPNKVTKEVVIESGDGQSRMSWVAMTSLWGSSSSHRSDSSDPIDRIGVRAYLYSGGDVIDSGVVMNYNSRYAWKWLYGNGDFAETYHTFEEPPYYWHPHTGDSG